jgi:hypothetical protein
LISRSGRFVLAVVLIALSFGVFDFIDVLLAEPAIAAEPVPHAVSSPPLQIHAPDAQNS